MTPEQFTAVVAALAALATAIAGLIGAVTVLYVRIESNRHAIDGRIDQLVATARVAGHAEGMALAHQLETPPKEP